MITDVELSARAKKDLKDAPVEIRESFMAWVEKVASVGLIEVRKVRGYNDEALKGKLAGTRSIRLNGAWRAYYKLEGEEVKIVKVTGVDKHKY